MSDRDYANKYAEKLHKYLNWVSINNNKLKKRPIKNEYVFTFNDVGMELFQNQLYIDDLEKYNTHLEKLLIMYKQGEEFN